MSDTLVRAIDAVAGLRVVAAITTDLVREAVERHQASGLGACALGRALTSGLLLATLTKNEERVTLQIRGDGPIGGLTVDAHVRAAGMADVRGYLGHPDQAAAPCIGRGLVTRVLGRQGLVNVLRDVGLTDRYQGQVPLLTGEVDEDVEAYLRNSEQVPSALGCDVLMRDGLAVDAAAGVLIQCLPGAANENVWEWQHAVRTGAVYDFLSSGGSDARALAEAVYGRALEVLGRQPARFQCRCSEERVRDTLRLLSVVDLDEMIAQEGHAEVTCNYCNRRYRVERPQLEELRAELSGGPRGQN